MNMHVFMNQKLLVIESNVEWAVPYWTERKRLRTEHSITWKFVEKK